MDIGKIASHRLTERMSNSSFKLMSLTFGLIDLFFPIVERRANSFGLQPGMLVVDYGCGPGRYAVRFARIVGKTGKVFAVDIHELAVEAVEKKKVRYELDNIQPILAHGYHTGLPDAVADRVFALDMFFAIRQPGEFLAEHRRLTKLDGILIIDNGHQPRQVTLQKIMDSGFWKIEKRHQDHLECRPV